MEQFLGAGLAPRRILGTLEEAALGPLISAINGLNFILVMNGSDQ